LEGATVHRDLAYVPHGHPRQKLDLYLPPAGKDLSPAGENLPLIIWVHGGAFRLGDKGDKVPLGYLQRGYAVASINYRLSQHALFPAQIEDCKAAVRWLRAHAAHYGYDPDRIAAGGGSAGGHLALLLGLSAGVNELEGTVGGHTNISSSVKAVVDLYGPTDLTEMRRHREGRNRPETVDPALLVHASPLTYLTAKDPPVLILHGSEDRTVPVEQSRLLHQRYQEQKLESELYVLEGAGHGGVVFSNEEQYGRIKAFLDRHL
jgi:acetyl esterase/lipase